MQKGFAYSRMNRLFILYWIAVLFFALPYLEAQQKPPLQDLQDLKLPISKNKITVHYSAGYEKKVLEIRPLLEGMMKFYEDKLTIKQEFSGVIVTREDWEKLSVAANYPYGIPCFTREPALIILPATGDNAATSLTLPLKDKISPSQLSEIQRSGYDFESAAVKFVDLIGLHEIGHLYSVTYGINPQNHWLDEFLATYFAYAFLKQEHPNLATVYRVMSSIDDPTYKPKYTSLDDFDRLYFGVGLENVGWYHHKLTQKVVQVCERKSLSFLADARKAFPLSEKQGIASRVALERLEKIDPGFVEWAKNLK